MILIFYAFAREIGPFKQRLKNRRPLGHRDLRGFHGEIQGRDIIAIASGIGMNRARQSARRAFELFPNAELAIGTGVAGALTEKLKPGDLVLADRVIARRDDAIGREEPVAIDAGSMREMGRMLLNAGVAYTAGAILTSHRALKDGAEKRRAAEATGAVAVDMETASIAQEAAARGIPFVCLRAIIDEIDDEVVGPKLDKKGNIRPIATTVHALRNPGALLQLPRMMTNLGRATRSLAAALEAIASRDEPAGRRPAARRS